MKADMERDIREYLARHPDRTIMIRNDIIDTGDDDGWVTCEAVRANYSVIMEDGTEVPVPFGTMFPE